MQVLKERLAENLVRVAFSVRGLLNAILIGSIKCYKLFISPAMPHSCRYYPSCSQYTIEAIEKYGPLKGGAFGAARILRCNQFFPGGPDTLE